MRKANKLILLAVVIALLALLFIQFARKSLDVKPGDVVRAESPEETRA